MQTLPIPAVNAADLLQGVTLLSPVLVLIATAVVVLIADLIPPDWASRRPLMWLAALGVVGSIATLAWLWVYGATGLTAFSGFLILDDFAVFFQAILLLAALLVILSATTFMDRHEHIEAEFYIAVLLSSAGLMVMAAGNELMTIYLALELSSLALAFLAAWGRGEKLAFQGLKSTEAGIKFFLLSAMSTAILLYGMALLYGSSGVTTLADISRAVAQGPSPVLLLAIAMVISGFGFKIAAAPFQHWTPDVYQGSPTPTTTFFSVASKTAGFAVLLRIFAGAMPNLGMEWSAVFGVLAFITMTAGNLVALFQTNIKRLMAYSSITHVGYVLIGLAAASTVGTGAVMYYLLAYAFTNLAAFIVITVMFTQVPDDEIQGYAGLASRSPWLALALTAALLSLAGIPPFVGFFSKLYLFLVAIEQANLGLQVLVIWAVIMSAVSLFYYGRVIHTMWMRPATDSGEIRPAFSQNLALATSVAGVVAFGVLGGPLLSAAQAAAATLGFPR